MIFTFDIFLSFISVGSIVALSASRLASIAAEVDTIFAAMSIMLSAIHL